MAWLNLTMPNQTVKNGLKAKKIKLPQMNFFLEKQLIKFSCTWWPLSFCKILKKFLEPIQSYEDVPFSGPKWSICPEQNFFGTNHYYYFHQPTGHFQFAKFWKNLTADPELWWRALLDPKWSNSQYQNFSENLLMILVSLIHVYLHAKNQSQILIY